MAIVFGNDGKVLYEGAVIRKTEHYWLDGMLEVHALVYDEVSNSFKSLQVGYYGADGYNLCDCYCKIDLTPENARKALRLIKDEAVRQYVNDVQAFKATVHKGDLVEVVRGRKVPKGTQGTVFWIGERFNQFSYENEKIAGIRHDVNDKSEKPVWVKVDYLKKMIVEKSPKTLERKKYITNYIARNYKDVLKAALVGRSENV